MGDESEKNLAQKASEESTGINSFSIFLKTVHQAFHIDIYVYLNVATVFNPYLKKDHQCLSLY